jgi:NADH-quinone oxidoreductase subunit H
MRLGWKILIPIAIAWLAVAACMRYFDWVSIGTGA